MTGRWRWDRLLVRTQVIGDVPNTASRIERLNKQLGTTILASVSVVREQSGLCLRPVGRFVLAGRPAEW